VVDDSVVARNQISRTLEKLGVKITLAKNGEGPWRCCSNGLAIPHRL
jgi:CheY-like chemotaxis protein